MSDYAYVHDGKAFTPNRTPVEASAADEHNANIERAELAQWNEQPARMLAYYKLASDQVPPPQQPRGAFRTHGTVATWRGVPLGVVTEARVYRHNFGSRMVSLRVKGSNGASYYGRASYDRGDCVWLRKTVSG